MVHDSIDVDSSSLDCAGMNGYPVPNVQSISRWLKIAPINLNPAVDALKLGLGAGGWLLSWVGCGPRCSPAVFSSG